MQVITALLAASSYKMITREIMYTAQGEGSISRTEFHVFMKNLS